MLTSNKVRNERAERMQKRKARGHDVIAYLSKMRQHVGASLAHLRQ